MPLLTHVLARTAVPTPLRLIHEGPVSLRLSLFRSVSSEAKGFRSPGHVLALQAGEQGAVKTFGLPRNVFSEFRLLSQPCTVIRHATIQALDIVDAAGGKPSFETRIVFTGDPGSGKSHLLLQVVEYCTSKDWVVLYIPRAVNLVNSTTTYTYDLRTQTYLQPTFAYQSLRRMLDCNNAILKTLRTQEKHPLERSASVPVGTSLVDLVAIGTKDRSHAPAVFSILFSELAKQKRYPVLLAVDDFQALYCPTMYRDVHSAPIPSYHLSMPRFIMEYASGKKTFARGAVFGAISTAHPNFQLPLELREALTLPHEQRTGPYAPRSALFQEYARGLQSFAVPDKLNVEEAASLFELWTKVHCLPTDESFLAKLSESSGNPKQFIWGGLLSSLAT